MRRKKTTDQYAIEKRWVFSFDLKDSIALVKLSSKCITMTDKQCKNK